MIAAFVFKPRAVTC